MTLSYDGHDLESLLICGDPQISILNFQPDMMDVKARNGSLFVGSKLGSSTVEFTIAITGSASERRAKLSTLGAWLMVDEPKPLILPDTPDRYYLAVPNGSLDMTRGINGESAQLTFTLTDPISYSVEIHSVTSVNGVATISVTGNAPSEFVLTNVPGQVITPGSWSPYPAATYWQVADGSGKYLLIDTTGDSGEVIIDTEKRRCRFNYSPGMPYWRTLIPLINSKWFKLQPGANTITRTIGGGEFVIEWRDRWY